MSKLKFGRDGLSVWERLLPPVWWRSAGRFVIADRHLPNGVRQHMVEGSVEKGLVIDNAEVIGEAGAAEAEFAAPDDSDNSDNSDD